MTGVLQVPHLAKSQCDSAFLSWYLREFVTEYDHYSHWSAGWRSTPFSDYHRIVIQDEDPNTHIPIPNTARVVVNADIVLPLPAHTSGRNHLGFATCIACMFNATTENLGPAKPTPEQIRVYVSDILQIHINHRIPVGRYKTHAEAADMLDMPDWRSQDNPGYPPYGPIHGNEYEGCERWDWFVDIQPMDLSLHPHQNPPIPGHMYFPDWVRSELILRIQKATEKLWKKA